jgi:DUF1680 family protein
MTVKVVLLSGILVGLLIACGANAQSVGYPLEPVSFEQVKLADDFWLPRLQIQRRTLVPYSFEQTHEALADLKAAADLLAGREIKNMPEPHRFRTSDLFKVMEGAAYLLALEPDPELEQQMDDIIATIAASQEPDGYLNATRTLYPHLAIDMMGDGKYAYVDHSHELYILGHLYEAAVAYFRATGKQTLLDVSERSARHVQRVFFEGDPNYNGGKPKNQAPGHEEIELALVKLAEATGNPDYLKTAQRFLDIRGVTYVPQGEGVNSPTYAQQHQPVTEQRAPAGHAVRATYLYAGMADVGAMLGTARYTEALEGIWQNIVDTRMHITGGLGAVHGIEGFGPEYFLPNDDAFNETCAAVGNVFFNWRMFLLHRDAKYLDVAEVALYNNVLAGVNLAGNRFFYINPLAADGARPFNHGRPERSPWFGTACCPTNIARLVPQVPGMIFAHDDKGLTLCLYAASQTKLTLGGVETGVIEKTNYPFDGRVQVTLNPARKARFAVRLRIPTWTGTQFVPGELYHYLRSASEPVKLFVNDEPVDFAVEKGLASIKREWSPGDTVRLELPMPVRESVCRPEVEADRNRVALTRGPLVYCAEAADNAAHVYNYLAPTADEISQAQVEPLTIGERTISALVIASRTLNAEGQLIAAPLKLVPYYAWNNRGVGSMAVWLPNNEQTLRAGALVIDDNARRFKSARATHTFEQDQVGAMIDGRLPKDSHDISIPRWTSWPERGKQQTLEFELAKPTELRSVEVYWYDDRGGVQVPERWELDVWRDGAWASFPLYNTDAYGIAHDQFNVVHPAEPLTTDRLRVKVWPRADAAVGILEFIVRPE